MRWRHTSTRPETKAPNVMKLTCEPLRLTLRDTFTIARESSDTRDNLIVRLTDADGYVGIGEAAPSPYYQQHATGNRAALAALPVPETADPHHLESLLAAWAPKLSDQSAAMAAVDMALHDLVGQRLASPLYRLWGLDPAQVPPTSYTIGLASPDEMHRKTAAVEGFQAIKVKLGTDQDRRLLEAVRRATTAPIRVDANAAWTVDQTLKNLPWLQDLGVELIEQPLPCDDLDGMRRVTDASPLPIICDESARTPEDVVHLRGACHGINIKLAKCGGLRSALKMIHIARAQSMSIMLGCFIESSIGMTAAAHLSPLVDYADLDGHLLLQHDPWRGAKLDNGRVVPPDKPGLGVALR